MAGRHAPITTGGHNLYEVVSALQKSIRRGELDDAIYFAVDMDLPCTNGTSYANYLWRRLRIIASEDVGLADRHAPLVIRSLYENWVEESKVKGSDATRLFIIHAVSYLTTARKDRLVDHALISHYTGHTQEHQREIPDYALDNHTARGKRMGRGIDFFFDEGAKLRHKVWDDPHPMQHGGGEEDPYRDQARQMLGEGRKPPAVSERKGQTELALGEDA